MTEVKKYKLNNEEFNYHKKLYIKKTAEKIIGRNISDIELDNIINIIFHIIRKINIVNYVVIKKPIMVIKKIG